MTCRKRKVKVSQTSAPDVLDTDNSSVTSSQWKAGSRAGYAVPLELNAPSTMMTTGRCRTTMLVPTDTRLTTDRNASKKHVRRLEERLEFLESTIRNLQGSGERKNSAQPAAIDGEELSRVSSASSSGNSTPAVATDDQANQEISNVPDMGDINVSYWHQDVFERPSSLIEQMPGHVPLEGLPGGTVPEQHVDMFPGHWLHTAPREPCLTQANPVENTAEFKQTYLQKWWKFQDMSIYLVDPKLYMTAYERGVRSQHYSEFSLNALLACSMRLDKSESIRNLSRAYAEKAKREIPRELEIPTMSTVHGFCLLSDYECTNGSENLGWIYVGMACRLIITLGLHQDCSELTNSGFLSKEDALARQRMTYGVFVYEQTWSLFLGRPSSLKASHIQHPFLPSGCSSYQAHLLAGWVDLCTLIRKVVNTCTCIKHHFQSCLPKCKQLEEALRSWERNLPPELAWSGKDPVSWPPSLCALYMQFCNIQLLLHRTVSSCQRDFRMPDLDAWPYSRQDSRKIMHENAVKIAQTLEVRRLAFEDWGFATLMLDIIFTAASTLITCMASNGNQKSALSDHKCLIGVLGVCEGLQTNYPVVKRMVSVLNSMLESTGLESFIWRGRVESDSGRNEASPSESILIKGQRALSCSSGSAAPFDPLRWCDANGNSESDHEATVFVEHQAKPSSQPIAGPATTQQPSVIGEPSEENPWFFPELDGNASTYPISDMVTSAQLNWKMVT
ncbi:hypothetical protein LTS17_001084 [Exophiala oligosperma]